MLQSMTEEQLDCTPTVYDPDADEYYPIKTLLCASDINDVLDKALQALCNVNADHPYLSF